MPATAAVSGGGIVIIFLTILVLTIATLVASITKIGIFAVCAFMVFYAIVKLKKGIFSINLVVLVFFALATLISGYVLLVDLNPIFLDLPAKAHPSLCELHDSPIFFLNFLRSESVMSGQGFSEKYYSECIAQTDRFGGDLEFCNEVKESSASDCIEAAVGAGATNCEILKSGYYQWMCMNDVGLDNYSMEDCEKIPDDNRMSQCMKKLATVIEDCEKIPYGGSRDSCYCKLAATPEECQKIEIDWERSACLGKLVDEGKLSEEEYERLTMEGG